MRRKALFSTLVAPSLVLWTSVSWSGAYEAGSLPLPDTTENLCRADQMASFAPASAEPSDEMPTRERVFGSPVRGVPTKGIIEAASTLLDYPMGSKFIMEVNGTPYGFRLERH
jgi:hypothetical protein